MVSMTSTQLITMKLPSLERNITTFCLHITLYYPNLVKCFFWVQNLLYYKLLYYKLYYKKHGRGKHRLAYQIGIQSWLFKMKRINTFSNFRLSISFIVNLTTITEICQGFFQYFYIINCKTSLMHPPAENNKNYSCLCYVLYYNHFTLPRHRLLRFILPR